MRIREYRFMKRQNPKNGFGSSMPQSPPQFNSSFVIKKRLRFQASTASTGLNLSAQSFGDLWCVAATATSAYQLAESVRLRRISIWSPPSASLVPVTCSIDWLGSAAGTFGNSKRVSDTSMSQAPARVTAAPPEGSQVGQWLAASGNSQTIVTLAYAAGSVIDIKYDLIVRDAATSASVAAALGVAGATVGANYIRPLDSTAGTATLSPISYSSV